MFFILHSFVNLFAGGRSDSKTFAFLLYVIFLLLFVYSTKKIIHKISLWYPGISVGLLYVYGLVSHMLLSHYYKVSLDSFVITGNNGELSSTTLWHIHEAKGIIGFVLSKIGIGSLKTIDAGGAYLHLLSSWWFCIGLLLLTCSLVFTVIYFWNFSRLYNTSNKTKNILFILFYAVISFSLIKTAIDGGILSPNLLALGIGVYMFYHMQKGRNTRPTLLAIFILSILGFATVLFLPDWSFGIVLMQAIGTLLILINLGIGIFGSPKKIYTVVAAFLFLIAWWLASARDQAIYRYGQTAVSNSDLYFFYSTERHEVQKVVSDKKHNIKQIVQEQHKNISYTPITVPGKTCSEGAPPKFADTIIKSDHPIKNIQTPFLYIKNKAQSFDGTWWQTKVVIMMNPCLPEPLTVIDDQLRIHGVNFYGMVNPVFYDESVSN